MNGIVQSPFKNVKGNEVAGSRRGGVAAVPDGCPTMWVFLVHATVHPLRSEYTVPGNCKDIMI